jgi:NADPH:quinone reductase-like Zn-dependent oxidoreductase
MGSDTQLSKTSSDTSGTATTEGTMQAVVQDTYGSADVLRLARIARPEIGDDELLLRVHAASVHIGDWHVMTGLPYLLRVVSFGFRAPKARVRGMDVAGTVEAVGQDVTQFQAGDEVFGTCDGSFADAVARVDTLAHKPANLTFEQAAAVPTSAVAALQALRDAGGITSGEQVLIVGASGGVGLFAVQIAKSFGAEVTGVCSTAKADRVRSVGADHVIDYAQEDFVQSGQPYDLILIMGENRSLSQLRKALRPGGRLVPVGTEEGNRWFGGEAWIHAMLLSRLVRHLRPLASEPNQADLKFLTELIEAGKITPVIDKTLPLSGFLTRSAICTEERLGERSSSTSEPQANPQRTLRRPEAAGYTTQEIDHACTAAINRAKPTQP